MQKTEPVARCRISIADLRHTPNEAVLVTKCLTVADPNAADSADAGAAAVLPEDSDTDESETSTAPSTRSGATQAPPTPPPVPFAAVSRGFAASRGSPPLPRGSGSIESRRGSSGAAPPPADGPAAARAAVRRLPQGAWTTVADPATGAADDVSESGVAVAGVASQEEIHRAASARAHMPPGTVGATLGTVDGSAAARAHPVHNSACGSAMTGYGSLASDAKPPEHVQASGWLMFEVRYPLHAVGSCSDSPGCVAHWCGLMKLQRSVEGRPSHTPRGFR